MLGKFAYKAAVRPDLRIGIRPQLYLSLKALTAPLLETARNTSPGRLLFSRATHVSLNLPPLVKAYLDGNGSPSLNHLIRALFYLIADRASAICKFFHFPNSPFMDMSRFAEHEGSSSTVSCSPHTRG